jgi:hypothetical protein
MTPTTRQYAGNGPPVTAAASVIVVSGRLKVARLAHEADCAAAGAATEVNATERATSAMRRFIGFPPQEVTILERPHAAYACFSQD